MVGFQLKEFGVFSIYLSDQRSVRVGAGVTQEALFASSVFLNSNLNILLYLQFCDLCSNEPVHTVRHNEKEFRIDRRK